MSRARSMKYILIIGDGMADYPVDDLEGKTPLQIADHPYMDKIISSGIGGTLKTIPEGMQPNTDVATLSILGYNPKKDFIGRGPLEAASMGVNLSNNEIALRCNLITERDGILLDYSAGHITTEEAKEIIDYINQFLGKKGEINFYSGVSYRHLLVLRGYSDKVKCVPPHEVMGSNISDIMVTPQNKSANKTSILLNDMIMKSKKILDNYPINKKRLKAGKNPANMIWPWGQGKKPKLQTLKKRFNISGAVISAVDVINGIGIYAGMNIIKVPGATGYIDTDYEGKAEYALKSLENHDFVLIHVEAPDEVGHMGDFKLKIKTIEDLDKKLLGRIIDKIKTNYTIAILADHMTPVTLRTHTADPVPFALSSSIRERKSKINHFDEVSVQSLPLKLNRGNRFLPLFFEYCCKK